MGVSLSFGLDVNGGEHDRGVRAPDAAASCSAASSSPLQLQDRGGTVQVTCWSGGGRLPPRNTVLHAPDGSWCEVLDLADNGTRQRWEAGPTPWWRIIEDAHQAWITLGRPGWERFGLTVTPDRQWIWLDSPHSEHPWPVADER